MQTCCFGVRGLAMRLAAAALCGAIGLAGCGAESPPLDEKPPPADAIRAALGPYMLAPGQETTVCITGYLPNALPIDVVRIETRQAFSHHVIFYRETDGVPDAPTPSSCPPLDLLSTSRAPLFIGETPSASMDLPTGVAYRLGSKAPFRIEGHFLNATSQPQQALAEIFLSPAPSGSTMLEADMVFLSASTQLNKSYDGLKGGLPPMRETTLDPAFWALPSDMKDSKFFALTSHQHRLGTHFSIGKSADAGAAGQLLYENTDWEHPVFKLFPQEAPLTFAAGEGFRWVCTFRNTTTGYVKFGQSAEKDEMCILWGYYYPSQGFRVEFL